MRFTVYILTNIILGILILNDRGSGLVGTNYIPVTRLVIQEPTGPNTFLSHFKSIFSIILALTLITKSTSFYLTVLYKTHLSLVWLLRVHLTFRVAVKYSISVQYWETILVQSRIKSRWTCRLSS